jgi:galactokinase/mevalonate kinase-like predicted kinase
VVSCSTPARASCRLTLGVSTELPEDPTLWNAATARYPLEDVKVEWSSDVPRSSGLAGSTALLAATLACVLIARGETLGGQSEFAELVRDVEKNEAGVQCGFQDAYMSVYGGLHHMDFAGKSPSEVGPFASMTALDVELPFLLVTTGVQRLSGSVHGPVIDRWMSGDEEIRKAVDEVIGIGAQGASFLIEGNLEGLAACMNRNQELIAGWGGSGEAIDRLVLDCLDCGAMAAKLAGAGMGGTVIALSPDLDSLEIKLRNQGYSQFMRPVAGPGLKVEEREV